MSNYQPLFIYTNHFRHVLESLNRTERSCNRLTTTKIMTQILQNLFVSLLILKYDLILNEILYLNMHIQPYPIFVILMGTLH